MENEIMNNEMEVEVNDLEPTDVVVAEAEEAEDAGKGLGIVIALGVAAVIAGIAIARKCKGKMTDWQIKRLEKQGYIVTKAERTVEDICGADECEEVEAEEAED